MKKSFNSVSDMITNMIMDPIFKQEVDKIIADIVFRRKLRPLPPKGYKYKPDIFDRMIALNMLNTQYFFEHIEKIIKKESTLSSKIRSKIQEICSIAVNNTMNYYKNLPKPIDTVMTMKYTCKRCLAYDIHNSCSSACTLRYDQINGVPQQPCPKPLTTKQLNILKKYSYEKT